MILLREKKKEAQVKKTEVSVPPGPTPPMIIGRGQNTPQPAEPKKSTCSLSYNDLLLITSCDSMLLLLKDGWQFWETWCGPICELGFDCVNRGQRIPRMRSHGSHAVSRDDRRNCSCYGYTKCPRLNSSTGICCNRAVTPTQRSQSTTGLCDVDTLYTAQKPGLKPVRRKFSVGGQMDEFVFVALW